MTFGEGCATGPNLSLWNVCGIMILQKYFFFFWMFEVDKDCKYYFKHFSKQLFKFAKPYIVEPSSYVPCMKSQEGWRLNVFSINFLQLICDQIVWFSAGCKNRIEKLLALRQYTIFLNQGKSINFDIDGSYDVYE